MALYLFDWQLTNTHVIGPIWAWLDVTDFITETSILGKHSRVAS